MKQEKEERLEQPFEKVVLELVVACFVFVGSVLAYATVVSLMFGGEDFLNEYPMTYITAGIAGTLAYGLIRLARALRRIVARNAMIRAFSVVYFMSLTDTKRANHNKPWRYGD